MPNTEIKLIATDLDGTLLRDDHLTLSPANREALTRAADAGIEVVVATGRSLAAIAPPVLELPFLRYFITCNGRAAAHGTRQEIAAALLDPKAFAVGTQQLSLDDFTPKVLPDAAPAVQKLAAAGMPACQAAYEVKQEALQCLTRRM